jgi:hypothetical protein
MCAVAVEQSDALQRLIDRSPAALLQQRDDYPRGGQERTDQDEGGASDPGSTRSAGNHRPDDQNCQREIAGLEMQRDRQRGEQHRAQYPRPSRIARHEKPQASGRVHIAHSWVQTPKPVQT